MHLAWREKRNMDYSGGYQRLLRMLMMVLQTVSKLYRARLGS